MNDTQDCFELQTEAEVKTALVLAEKRQIRTDLESGGNLPDYVQGRLGGDGFVTAQMDHMNADAFGQGRAAKKPNMPCVNAAGNNTVLTESE